MAELSATEMSEVFRAGWQAVRSKDQLAADVLMDALMAMENKCIEISVRRPSERMTP